MGEELPGMGLDDSGHDDRGGDQDNTVSLQRRKAHKLRQIKLVTGSLYWGLPS